MEREEIKISLNFMRKVVVQHDIGGALVAAVAAEEVKTAEEDKVDVEVAVARW